MKPLKDWTLEEARAYCDNHTCDNCSLLLKKNNDCRISAPRFWELEGVLQFTMSERTAVRVMEKALCGYAIEKTEQGEVRVIGRDGSVTRIEESVFPSLYPDQRVKISDIIGD